MEVTNATDLADVADVACTEAPLGDGESQQATHVSKGDVPIECDLVVDTAADQPTDADVGRDALAFFGEDPPEGAAVLAEPVIVAEALGCDNNAEPVPIVVAVEDNHAG